MKAPDTRFADAGSTNAARARARARARVSLREARFAGDARAVHASLSTIQGSRLSRGRSLNTNQSR